MHFENRANVPIFITLLKTLSKNMEKKGIRLPLHREFFTRFRSGAFRPPVSRGSAARPFYIAILCVPSRSQALQNSFISSGLPNETRT